MEKADKIAHNYVDKACKADTFEKKLYEKNSKSSKLKDIADKKLLLENEELNGKISQASVSKVELERARKEYKNMQKELAKSCESFETQRCAYLDRINELETELEVSLEKFKAFKEEKNSEISQIQTNITDLTNQKQQVLLEFNSYKHDLLQKMEADKNFRLLIEKENQTLQQEIVNLKNIVQELSTQAELSGQKLIEVTHENSKQTQDAEKEKEILEKELQNHISQNEVTKSALEKEKLISQGLSQKVQDQSESISLIQTKYTACVTDLQKERAEYKTSITSLKSSHEQSKQDYVLLIGQLKEQLTKVNDDGIKKEEYYQSLLTKEKEINAGLYVKVHDQTSKISYMEECLEMNTVQNNQQVQDLNYELNNLELKYSNSQNQLSLLQVKIQNLEGVVNLNESTHSDERAKLLSRISDLEFLKTKLNGQVQESQNLIQEQNMVIQKLEDSLNEQTLNAVSVSHKYHTMEVEMKDLMKRFTTNKVVLEEEKNSHEQTRQISEERISVLEKEISEVNQNSTDKEKLLQSLLESEKEKCRQLSTLSSESQSKILTLQEELKSAASNHGAHVQSMQKELADMNVKNDELSLDNLMLKTNISQVKEDLKSMTETYNSMEAALTSNVNSLEEQNQHLLELSGSLNEKTGMIEMLEKINLEKDATISNMQDQLYLSNEELKSNLTEKRKLELELADFEEKYKETADSYEKNVHSLKKDASELKREKDELLSRISELDTELIELHDIIKEKDTAAKSLQDEITNLNNTIEGMQVKTCELEAHVAVLESCNVKAVELERKLQSSKADALMLENVVSEKDLKIAELDGKMLEKNVIISDLEAQVLKSTLCIQSLEENIEANKQLFSETQERLMASISLLNVEIQSRQNDIYLMQDKLDSSIKECDEAQARSLELNNSMQTQSAQVLEMEIKLKDADGAIAHLQSEKENNLIHIKRSDLKISELEDKNQKLVQLVETSAQCEEHLRDEIKDIKKIYCELESKSQSQIEDYQAEREDLHELLVRDREEYKLERSYFNDQMTALTGQLNREIVLKENEMTLCKDLSVKVDTLEKEKTEIESRLKEISSKFAKEELGLNLKEQVDSLSSALDFKSKMLKDLESQMEDCQSRLSVAELRLLNELSSKEMHFKSFEDRLKSKCSEVENLTKSHLEMKKNLSKVNGEYKNLLSEYEKSKASIARFKEVERLVLLEKKNLESGHKDSVSQVDKYKKEIQKYFFLLKILV